MCKPLKSKKMSEIVKNWDGFWGCFFFCLRWRGSVEYNRFVQLTCPPLTELNQCAFVSDSYLMFEPSRQQGCTTLGAFVLKTKPHFSTPFFVSVWYKSQVVQFEQKSRDINKRSRYRKKFKLFCLLYAIFIAIKSVYLARIIGLVKCPILPKIRGISDD